MSNNRERDRNTRFWAHILRTYGVSKSQYEAMWKIQDGKCAICGNPETSDGHSRLGIDHNHTTGKVRQLLCTCCNTGLGVFHDDPTRLMRAIAYLERHNVP